MNKISKEIKDALLEENENLKITEDILYYGEARARNKHCEENSEVIELMFSTENRFEVTENEVEQNYYKKLSLISYRVIFPNQGRFLILNDSMEKLLQNK